MLNDNAGYDYWLRQAGMRMSELVALLEAAKKGALAEMGV